MWKTYLLMSFVLFPGTWWFFCTCLCFFFSLSHVRLLCERGNSFYFCCRSISVVCVALVLFRHIIWHCPFFLLVPSICTSPSSLFSHSSSMLFIHVYNLICSEIVVYICLFRRSFFTCKLSDNCFLVCVCTSAFFLALLPLIRLHLFCCQFHVLLATLSFDEPTESRKNKQMKTTLECLWLTAAGWELHALS